MKRFFLITFSLVFLVANSRAAGNPGEKSVESGQGIVAENLKSIQNDSEAVEKLSSIVNDSKLDVEVRITAIEDLTRYPTKESISVLIDNISLGDNKVIAAKAAVSLKKIGMVAMPAILGALEKAAHTFKSEHDQRQMDLVQIIMQVTDANGGFEKWYSDNANSLDKNVRNAIRRYAVAF